MEIKGNISIIRKFVKKIIKDLETEIESLNWQIKEYDDEIERLEIINKDLQDSVYYCKKELKTIKINEGF